jgi:amino acid adenylation domain-containing protein
MSNLSWSPAIQLAAGVKIVGRGADTVEDAYPLTWMQQAMLLHGRRDPGLYLQQYLCTLREPLRAGEFRAAWQRLAARHPILRTSFHPDAAPEPLQVVHGEVDVPWSEHDWRDRTEEEQDEAMRAFLRDDRATPFCPEEAPLSRFALFRMEDEVYVLVWTSHHALIDGRSRRILLREVFEAYEAALGGRELAPAPRTPFGGYVRWLREAEPADSRAFWEEELRGFEGPNELVRDGGGGGLERERYRFELPDGLAIGLRLLAQREEITLNTVLQGGWALLLGHYTGDDDVMFGATRMCRRGGFPGVEEVVGLLVNTVPVRVRLDRARPVRDYLDQVRALWVRMRPHERTHLARIQEWRGSAGGAPLFQSVFGFESETAQEGLHRLGEGWWRRGFDLLQWTGYPLAVVAHGGERISVEVVYDPALFTREAILRMEGHFSRILRAFAEDAGQPLGRIGILSHGERRHLLDGLNPPARATAECAPIHVLLRAQAERTPDAAALVFGGGSLTYGELEWRSNQLARLLARHGAGLETRVGVCMERSPELVIALAAILKAGGAFVPLDPENPRDRLAFVLRDAGVSLLLCDAQLAERLPADGPPRLVAEPGWAQAAGESAEPVGGRVPSHALAYVMYTSGSTGTPKGVAVEHRGVVRLVRGAAYAALGPDEVILQAAPVSFDASTLEIWGALLNGGRLVLPPAGTLSLEALGRAVVQHGVTTLWLTAGLFQVMVDEQLEAFAGVRQLLTGGDVVPVTQAARIRARFPGLRLINGYGPTENTTFTCCHTVPAEWSGGPIPIGAPIGGTRVYLLDDVLRPVPVGVPGELYAGGTGVARGYVDRPGTTAERFVPDPFAGVPGARMYRTGDRARWRPDGAAEFLGRRDGQVKIRGLRIETGEIEAALRGLPGVGECVVAVREDAPGEKRLAAYVTGGADAEALRASLRGRLPEYMVPGAFVRLDRLPLNANGKVDRRALPAPERRPGDERRTAPRTPVEEVLAGVWAAVLGMDRVGVEERFFELGGHSLLAMRVLSRVRELFGVELPVRAMFDGATVAAMAERVEEMRRSAAPGLPPVAPVARTEAPPLSFAQERLWFLDRLEGASALYNVPVARRLSGALDAAALERALGGIVRRHEALRTTFREVDGLPVQVIAPYGGFVLPVADLSGLGGEEREAEAARRTADDAARPFDLHAGPLFRATLLRLGSGDHLLLLCMHHAVTDGWSMGVLFRELSALYGACRDGGEPSLPPPAVQYADYAAWHRRVLSGPLLERQLAWWRERLAGAPELLELPTDRPRPAARTHRGAYERIELDGGLLARLEAVGRRQGATLYMVLLGAFQALLSRYTGSGDVVVGSPVAGRTRKEVEDVIGLFVNTLAMRTDLSGDPSFAELLRRVREGTLGAFEHQDVPFERLVAELRPERSLGHAPIVQVSFVLQDGGQADGGLEGLRVEEVETHSGTAKFDLALSLEAGADGLHGRLAYSTDLFERPTIRRMAGHLEAVLRQVAGDADVRLSGLRLMGGAERARVVGEWSGRTVPGPDRSVHARFAAQAERTPGAVAVESGGGSLTYRELDLRANRLARRLRALGVGPEVRVGVCLDRSAELVVSLLAVLRTGGAYVPVDPGHPAERIAYVLEDSAAGFVLTHSRLAGRIPPAGARRIAVDEVEAEGEDAAPLADAGAGMQALAYVIYTSGSTGRPKGVGVPHGALASHMAWMQRAFPLDAADRVLQRTPVGFDASVWEFWAPLLAGATLVLAGAEEHGDPARILRAVAGRGITVLQLVPSLLAAVLDEAGGERRTALRRLFCGGEALPAELARRARAALGAEVVNLYGPTEVCIDATFAVHGGADRATTVPIGVPVDNVRAYVLDAGGEPVPAGVPGELYLAGAQLARGYLGRPALTAERFVPDPLGAGPGARLYRTGDRARWLASGVLEYLGRVDEQVKIRGVRIEPGEIEAVLCRHAGVRAAAVVAREDAGEKRLVAYVVGDAGAEALRAHLRESLPDHMVPAAFVALPSLPTTRNGKLDSRALPAPEFGPARGRYVAPRTPVEEVLAEVWAAVLRLERVGVEESFFDLGGHSLLATRVASRVREALGAEVPVRALFEAPTVAELAERVEALRRDGRPVPAPVVPVERTSPPPLSSAQEGLWFLHRLAPRGAAYNVPVFLRLSGALDVAALERALGEVVRRHETLRTVFAQADGAPVQVIAPFAGFALAVEELSALEPEAREAEAGRRAADEAARPFDLAEGPLFRAALLRLDAGEHLLLMCMHHIVVDGWSVDVLFAELSALYGAYRDGGESPLEEPAVQYADHAAWERGQLPGDGMARQLAYWKERMRGAPPLLELPTDRPRPAAPSYRGGTVALEIPAALAARLRALGRAEGATPYMVLMAAFQVVLGRYAGSEDVVVGTPLAGRARREVEGLIGYFVNTLPLRTDLGGDPTFGALLRRVREATLGAYEHQQLPFDRLVAELRPERTLSYAPLFQATLALQAGGGRGPALPGLEVRPVHAGAGTAKYDLSLTFEETADGLRGVLTYAADLFDRATAGRMAAHVRQVLEQAADGGGVRLSALALMGAEERARRVEAWRPRAAAPAPEGSLHGRFEAQARRTPGAVAVTGEGESLAYGELDARADRVARRLRALGVGPEVRVGLCLERSPEIAVAILGVLKAGGAYVPIDPAYPEDRIAYLVEDSGVPVVVAREGTANAVSASAARVLLLDDLLADGDDDGGEVPADVHPDTAAYVIYTSGSTGRPKGVVVTHANVLRLFGATDPWFGFGADDVWTFFHSYAFDFSVWEIWGALLYGGRLVVVPFAVSRDPAAFRGLLAREGVTVLNQTPSAFRQLVHADREAEGALALRWVVFGGEALEPRSLAPWYDRHGDRRPRLVNMYGITETTVHVTFRALSRADAEAGGSMIGEPIPDLGVYLLDGGMEPVPPGVPGEIFVGGAGPARGYLGRPALTAERFVPDPFAGVPGARMYRSGDRARGRADGDNEYLGRADMQVKVRGFRIEPGEIEAALAAHPGVREAVVLAREDEPGVRRLVAYVVPSGGDEGAAPETLRAALAERLPDYMVPAAFVRLDAIPLTPHGKVDRRALPAPDGRGLAGAEYAAPRGPVEEALAAAWAEALGVERVGAHDNYFALGGDSMRAIRLLALARARGVPFSLAELFRHQTVAELAAGASPGAAADGGAGAGAAPFSLLAPDDRAGVPGGVVDAYPMTRLQLGMLFHSEQSPDHAVYHNVQAYRVHAPFDEARLRGVLAALAERHPVLRTSFDLAGFSEPVQLVHGRVALPLAVTSLDGVPAQAVDAELRAWFAAERAAAFDWRTAPLIRFHVHTLGPDLFRLGFTEHHAILDGWSVAGLLADLFALYADEGAANDPAPASVLPDFVALEREVLASAEAGAFWAGVLEGAEPTVPAALGIAGGEGSRLRRGSVPAGVSAALAASARREGLPLKSLLLAAHLRVLSAAAGTDDVTTGVVVNGRPEGGQGERALGLFLNTIPCRLRLSGGSWLELARDVFAWERTVLPYRRYPVAELQRMRGGQPPFASLFNFIHFHNAAPALRALRVEREVSASARLSGVGGTSFPFGVSFEAVGDDLLLFMEYDAARYSDAEADAVFDRYLAAVEAIAADPRGRSGACDLMSPAERARVAGWGAAEPRAAAATLHGLVADRAARTPGAVAVEQGGRTLTFAGLERGAARLARVLRGRGVGPEARVGICCSRSPEMVVAWLAVLRAGGAVVPLDPSHPAARTSFILGDAGVRLLLTDASTAGVETGGAVAALRVDEALRDAEGGGAEERAPAAGPAGAAYVVYTSGSTGTPKGVVVEHGAAAAHVAAFAGELGLSPADRVLHFAPLGFDVAVEQLFAPLAGGATAVLVEGDPWTPAEWAERARGLGITVANLPPAYWLEVIAAGGGTALPALRLLIVGADAMPAGAVAGWRNAVRSGARLRNAYGPTETVVTATTFQLPEAWPGAFAGAVVPIGSPLPGRAARVLDAFGAPAAPGVPGELYLGGLLARGYLGQPRLTAERFVPDPFSDRPGARLYRTGDRARWLPSGALEFLGRLDAQVKVRGYRIEPGEIEAALALHPAVREAAVVPRDAGGGGRRLAAYLVAAPGADAPPAAELRARLRERLPEYMVPSTFTWLDAFPLTPNGKLDRRALPAPDAPGAERDGDAGVAPRDALELRLARVWEELLGVEQVGVRDDFFALGGHSLAALRLLATVERVTGRRLSMAGLLAAPTVEHLARALRGDALPAAGALVPLRAAGDARPLFFVHAAGGNVVSYAALARHLGAGQPFYGLQSRGLDGDGLPRVRVEEMAAAYLAELRAVQPEGPYRLGGWSMGGVVAFEMARVLAAAGEAVELLALVDSRAPVGAAAAMDPDDPALLAGFARHLGLDPERISRAVDADAPAGRLRRAWEAAREADAVPADLELARFEGLWSVFRANVAAASAYRPGPGASDILLVLAGDRAAPGTAAAGWRALTTGTVRTATVAGDHFALVREPHVRALAAVLADALAPAPSGAPDGR